MFQDREEAALIHVCNHGATFHELQGSEVLFFAYDLPDWNEYALAPDAQLTEQAKALKQSLLAHFAEVSNAAQTA